MMDRDSSIDSNLSNATSKDRPARKSTIHDLYASREKHRAKSVKQCRTAAEQISQNNTKINNMDVLFKQEVSIEKQGKRQIKDRQKEFLNSRSFIGNPKESGSRDYYKSKT